MFVKQKEINFDNGDELRIRLYTNGVSKKWIELYVWDDYECEGGSVSFNSIDSIDSIIEILQELRKEIN